MKEVRTPPCGPHGISTEHQSVYCEPSGGRGLRLFQLWGPLDAERVGQGKPAGLRPHPSVGTGRGSRADEENAGAARSDPTMLRTWQANQGPRGDWDAPRPGSTLRSEIRVFRRASRPGDRNFVAHRNLTRGRFAVAILRNRQSAREQTAQKARPGGRRTRPALKGELLRHAHGGRWRRCRVRFMGTSSQAQTGGRDGKCCEDLDEFHEILPSFHGKLLRGTLAKPNQLTTKKLKKITPVAASRTRWS